MLLCPTNLDPRSPLLCKPLEPGHSIPLLPRLHAQPRLNMRITAALVLLLSYVTVVAALPVVSLLISFSRHEPVLRCGAG